MKKSIFITLILCFIFVNCVKVFAKEDSFDLDPDDPNFQIDTKDVTVTYPETNVFSYDGNEKIFEPDYSDVYQKLYSVKNTEGYAIDTGIPMGETRKVLARMVAGYLDEDATSYYIGVGNYGDNNKNRIGIGCYLSGIHGIPPLFGILVCVGGSQFSYGFDERSVANSNFIGVNRVYALSFNHTSRNAIFTQDYNDYAFDINATTSLSSDFYDELMDHNTYIGGENSTIYLVKVEKNNGTDVYLFPARKVFTDTNGVRKWVYGLYSDETDAIDQNAVTNGTTFSYISGTLFDKYTILESLKNNSDSSFIYGSSDEVPVKDKASGEIGLYNLKTNSFSKLNDVTAGAESTDIFRYEGVTRATEVGDYKCKAVLSSLGKALKLNFSDTSEHEWSIKGTITKPTLEKNELVYDEGNVLKPTLQYEKDGDSLKIDSVVEGHTDVGNYSVKNTIKNKSLYAWHDFTYDDVLLNWKIIPKDIDIPVLSKVVYKYTNSSITPIYNNGDAKNVNLASVNHVAGSIVDKFSDETQKCINTGYYKQIIKHDTNTKWEGIDVSATDSLEYYFAIYDDYLNFTLDSNNTELKNALLTDTEKTNDDSDIVMWASCEKSNNMNAKKAITNEIKKDKLEIDEAIDIDVFKEIKFAEPIQCEELNNEITMSIDVPSDIKETDTVELYRYHDGAVEKLDITIDSGRITFTSDKFSMFAICRNERPKKDNPKSNPKYYDTPFTGIQ